MALISNPMVPRDGTIEISDATGSPITLTVQYEDGDFQFSELEEGYVSAVILKDRGTPYSMRKTEGQEPTFTFTAHATDFTDATEKTLIDAALKKGAFAAGVSKLGANADVWAVQVKFIAEQTNFGAGADSAVTFLKCRISVSFSEGVPGKFSMKGTIYIGADADVVWA